MSELVGSLSQPPDAAFAPQELNSEGYDVRKIAGAVVKTVGAVSLCVGTMAGLQYVSNVGEVPAGTVWCGEKDAPNFVKTDNRCEEQRTGILALVNVKGLGKSPTEIQVTDQELNLVGKNVTSMLYTMTDGAVSLTPKVYDAPESVGKEVQDNYAQNADSTACIDSTGYYTTGRVAAHRMSELTEANSVIAFGGTSCAVEYIENDEQRISKAAGTAHPGDNLRVADIYMYDKNPNRVTAITQLTETVLHEELHLMGLAHLSDLECKEGMETRSLDLVKAIEKRLASPSCTYSEYGGYENIMGLSKGFAGRLEDPRLAKRLVLGVQADFISGREPSSPGASSTLINKPGSYQIHAHPSNKFTEPYTAVIPLEKPIQVNRGGTEHSYDSVVLDYKTPDKGRNSLGIYLADDIGDNSLKTLEIGEALIPKDGRTLTIENKTLVISRPADRIMGITVR